MLQTSSSNQTHVLVASNNISLSCLEGRIYIITLLNPLPVLIILLNPLPVALKILRDILSFTRSFMINTRPLVECLENSDRKVKQFRVIPRIASSRLVYSSSIQCPKWMCLVLQRDSRFVSGKLSRNRKISFHRHFHRHIKMGKKRPSFCLRGHTVTLLTIYHRRDREYCSQSENASRFILKLDRNMGHVFWLQKDSYSY